MEAWRRNRVCFERQGRRHTEHASEVEMMPFQCLNCKKVFVYPAKLTFDIADPNGVVERHVCPHCLSIKFEETPEQLGKIVSVKSVDLAQVDEMIVQGYEVKELYAKTATLIKKEVSKQEAEKQ